MWLLALTRLPSGIMPHGKNGVSVYYVGSCFRPMAHFPPLLPPTINCPVSFALLLSVSPISVFPLFFRSGDTYSSASDLCATKQGVSKIWVKKGPPDLAVNLSRDTNFTIQVLVITSLALLYLYISPCYKEFDWSVKKAYRFKSRPTSTASYLCAHAVVLVWNVGNK